MKKTFAIAIADGLMSGKSTLFNRLVARRWAIIDDSPGVDRGLALMARRGFFDLRSTLYDTGGLRGRPRGSLAARTAAVPRKPWPKWTLFCDGGRSKRLTDKTRRSRGNSAKRIVPSSFW
jgi:hypothetical protein